jgi:hypothetical protein
MVRRLFRVTLIVSLGLLVVFAGGALAFWKALHLVPEFYQKAMLATPAYQDEASGATVAKTATPAGDHQQQESGWDTLFAQAEALANQRQSQMLSAAAPAKAGGEILPPTPAETGDEIPPPKTAAGGTPEQNAGWNALLGRAETLASQRQTQRPATTSPNQAGNAKIPPGRSPANDMSREGRWNGLFTAEELNRWLAVNVREHLGKSSYGSMNDLRVAIGPEAVAIGCRLQRGRVNTVFSLSGEAELVGDNVIAVRIQQAKAGAVPLRMNEVAGPISKAADCCGLEVRWQQAGGDPVAMITLPLPRGTAAGPAQLDTLRLGEGEAWLSGSAGQR